MDNKLNCIVISDKCNEKRKLSCINQFNNIGIKPDFFDAIMGNTMSKDKLKTFLRHGSKEFFLSPGEIGCALSHLGVYKLLLESNENSIIIFEDDVLFDESMSKDILMKLQSFIDSQENPAVIALYDSTFKYGKPVDQIDNYAIYKTTSFWCTHGYIINRQAAKNILNLQTPIAFVIDWWRRYYYLNACQLFCLNHDIIKQNIEIISSIESERECFINRNYYSRREKIMAINYRELFWSLSIKDKVSGIIRRLKKHLIRNIYE
jgi:hypothetical protein